MRKMLSGKAVTKIQSVIIVFVIIIAIAASLYFYTLPPKPTLTPTPTPTRGVIEGSVTDCDGDPVAGMRVSILSGTTSFPEIAAETDEDGYYQIASVPSGTFIVGVHDQSGYKIDSGNVEVMSGEPSTLDFVISSLLAQGIIGKWPYGHCDAVVADGNYAYIGVGGLVKVIDVSDPSSPIEISSMATPSAVKGLFKDGDYLYVANRNEGILILDVSDPSHPLEMTHFTFSGQARDIYVTYPYAYVANHGLGLRIIDISNHSNLIEIGHSDVNVGGYWDVYASGSYAFVAAWDGGLHILNISDPSNPVLISEVDFGDTSTSANRVIVVGNYAYVANFGCGLRIVDASDPANPVIAASLFESDWVWDVHVSSKYLYVLAISGLHVLDITDPLNLIEIGFCLPDTIADESVLYISGDYAYIADSWMGLLIVDISDPTSPVRVGFFDTPGYVYEVFVSGNYAFVANGDFSVVDVSDPSDPVTVGSIEKLDDTLNHGDAIGVWVSDTSAYVVGYKGRLSIIDVSDPLNPEALGGVNTPDDASGGGVHVSDHYAYVAGEYGGLRIIDVSDPSKPVDVGSIYTPGYAYDVFVLGSYAYVADFEASSLHVIDVSAPLNPIEVGSINTPSNAMRIRVSNNHAYVGCWGGSLQVVDISDPSNPVEVATRDTGNNIWGICVSEEYAYIANADLVHIDVSDPSNPTEIYRIGSGEAFESHGVHVSGNYVYVTDRDFGMVILKK